MSKLELVQELTASRDGILVLLDGVSDQVRKTIFAGSEWNMQDELGHLAYWEQQTLNHIRETFAEGRPRPLPPEGLDNDLNGQEVKKRHGWDWKRIRAEFVNARGALLERINLLDETNLQFYVPSPWTGDERVITLETLIREDVLQHAEQHRQEMEQWLNK